MPTITVKPNKKRVDRLTRRPRRRKVPRSDVIRSLINRAGPTETRTDLSEWVNTSEGKGLGMGMARLEGFSLRGGRRLAVSVEPPLCPSTQTWLAAIARRSAARSLKPVARKPVACSLQR